MNFFMTFLLDSLLSLSRFGASHLYVGFTHIFEKK